MSDEILTMLEACKFLKISRPTLQILINEGKIPHKRIQRRTIFSSSELEKWVAKGEDK